MDTVLQHLMLFQLNNMSENKNTFFTILFIVSSILIVFGLVYITLDDFQWKQQFDNLVSYFKNLN
jgi:hypothetical protein